VQWYVTESKETDIQRRTY